MALLTAGVACVTDLQRRRIPNVLTFGSAAMALVFHAASGGVADLGAAASGCLIAGGIFFLPFALGGMGAGDVKLLAALGAWFGPADAVSLVVATAIAGAVLAFAVAYLYGYLWQALVNLRLMLSHWWVVGLRPVDGLTLAGSSGPRLAYAVPIFLGTVVTVWLH